MRGRQSGRYYMLDNTKGKPLSLEKLKEFANEREYILGGYTTKSINRFGDVSTVVATLEFLPKNEFSSFVFEKMSYTSLKLDNLKNHGVGYLFMPNTSKNTYFLKEENIRWSGELKGNMLQGDGIGFVQKDGQVYVCFSGKFEGGLPTGSIEYKYYPINNVVEYTPSSIVSYKTNVGKFVENLASFEYQGYYGFIHKNGETAVLPQFTAVVKNFENGRATVVKNGSKVYIDSRGKIYNKELYSNYAKHFVEERLKKWQAKDPFETLDEYKTRVTEETRKVKAKELLALAEKEYIKLYTKDINLSSSMKLRPYDAENGVFLIESDFGELIVPVPRADNEARDFAANWTRVKLTDPQFFISNDKVYLSDVTFTTPDEKSYHSAVDKSLNYTETEVDVRFDALDYSMFATSGNSALSKVNRQKQSASVGKSDVDVDIPEVDVKNENTFAFIICNENYEKVIDVPMALNDGKIFAQYCEKTLGLPSTNVRIYEDASYGNMRTAINSITSIAEAYEGITEGFSVIFYYAGHGIPDERSKDAFLLPVDADGTDTEVCISQKSLYEKLGKLGAKSVIVFQDACFSGSVRGDEGMIVAARGVAIKAKSAAPQGNMVVFSAVSGEETAMPYAEKGHGLFTYYLLKKLQETKGNVTLSELEEFVSRQVKLQSRVVNHKPQTPSVQVSAEFSSTWGGIKIGK